MTLPENTGILWEDSTPTEAKNKKIHTKTEREKILEATAYFKKKYGFPATIVYINIDADFSIKKDAIDDITIKKVKYIMPNNIWIT
jgi:C1A family cysteine protease